MGAQGTDISKHRRNEESWWIDIYSRPTTHAEARKAATNRAAEWGHKNSDPIARGGAKEGGKKFIQANGIREPYCE
jgi:hypothetical protein